MGSMMYSINIRKSRCVLCRYCEVVCALSMGAEFDPDVSRIKEIREKVETAEIVCDPPEACRGAPRCVDACDERAIRISKS
jgi:Fe-S-cluster-containing hydrogenase component 2